MSRLASVVGLFGPALVGAVLAFAGLAKALEPDHFVRHLKNLRLLPNRLVLPAALIVVSLQCGLGIGLLLRLWPAWLLPAAMVFLLGLAALGYWSTTTGRTADCGCYNGLLAFSPRQSLLLDVGYASLLGFSWWWGGAAAEPGPWEMAAVLFATLGGGLLAFGLLRHSARHGKSLLDLTPMKVGRPWKARWLPIGAGLSAGEGETLVVFLGANCSHCMQWIKVLNRVHQLPGMPSVQGVVTVRPDRLTDYLSRAGARFPVAPITPWAAARLSRSITPTGVVVRDGVIQEKWVRSMPKSFIDRLRAEVPRAAAPVPG
jgi:hypothetical protein